MHALHDPQVLAACRDAFCPTGAAIIRQAAQTKSHVPVLAAGERFHILEFDGCRKEHASQTEVVVRGCAPKPYVGLQGWRAQRPAGRARGAGGSDVQVLHISQPQRG